MRPWLALPALALVATATARPAAAEDTSVLNGGKVKVQFYIPKTDRAVGTAPSTNENDYTESEPTAEPLPNEFKRYFNSARCECDRTATDDAAATSQLVMLRLSLEPRPSSAPGSSAVLQILAGDDCANTANPNLEKQCAQIDGDINAAALYADMTKNVFARIGDLVAPGKVDGMPRSCDDAANDMSSDLIVVSGTSTRVLESAATTKVPFDLKAPEMPTDVSATGLESSLRISWDAPTVAPKYYQALCAKADGSPAHSLTDGATANATDSPKFDTIGSVCGKTPAAPEPATIGGDTTSSGALPAPLVALDRNYVCGESSGTSTSIDLGGLDNDTAYWVVVLAIDDYGNYDARYLPHTIQPVPSIDFWEDVNAERPEVNGGFCVSQVGRDGGAAPSALLVLGAIGVAVRRRRRARRRSAAGAATLGALAVLALAPGAARAQSWDPYWVEGDSGGGWQPDDPKWHVGLRVGPYYPQVDQGFTSDPGPYRRMFGPGYNLVPQLDLHRLWQLPGFQLGVGASGGYYRKTAKTYAIGSLPTDPNRERTDADNTFKMIPLSVTGLARLTVLDDRWGIPIVPYLRGGFAYNVWWVRTATGDLAMSCDTCEDKAFGASAGLVGAVGISLRGERIDKDAMASMRNGGVEHAGFYAELETSWVDGFGNSARLSLGDTTWYAGLDFEF